MTATPLHAPQPGLPPASAPLSAVPSAESGAKRLLRDPRIPFALLLTAYGVLGLTVLGFNRSPVQMLLTVTTGCVLDMVLGRFVHGEWKSPLSAYITCCSLALLLNYSHANWLLFVPVFLAIGSKYLLTFEGRHVFNPSMFGVSVSLLATSELITAAPAYQWIGGVGGSIALSLFLGMAGAMLFVFRVGKGWLVASFLIFYALQTALRAWIMRHHLPPETLFLGTMSTPSFFLFSFYMITDPATSPKTPRGQVLFAFVLTLVDLYLHTKESVFTFFYAALAMGAGKFLFLHARALLRSGPGAYLKARLVPVTAKRFAAVGALAALLLGVYGVAQASGTLDRPLSFRMERLDPKAIGLGQEMGRLFDEVDPRLQHVSKWILSVGDAVATGDFDGDGRMDLFLTSVLKRAEDRSALYRNVPGEKPGDFRFERVRLPALDALEGRHRDFGLSSGAAFVDYDGDGDEDLLLAMSFGATRLLRNELTETGTPDFIDVTVASGINEPTVSLASTFFDFDRDGVLDLLITNAVTPLLRGYEGEVPLNVFDLKQPEHPGDRRMLQFMHNGWHNADNGGINALYRGRRDGRFEKLDMAAMGMPDTHWSLAVSTADLNRDGWTDLYIASDFGPDDVYLNQRGRRFQRVQGRTYGEIGKDTYKGMNASIADFDGNGWLDVYVSNVHHSLQAEGSLLWMVGPGSDPFMPKFSDEATARGALNERRFGWGASAGDLDNDGWPDIVQANGMVDDRLDPDPGIPESRKDYWYVNHKLMQSGPEIHTYADMWGDLRGRTIYPNEARRLYLNRGATDPGTFVDVAEEAGLADPDNSRGVSLVDLDDDGDLDAVIANQHGPVSVYRNTRRQSGAGGNFIGLRLVGNGKTTHRTAIGTQVVARFETGGRKLEQLREVGVLGGFSGQSDPRLHFGLGDHQGPVELTVRWYGGEEQRLVLEPNRYHVVVQP